MTRKRNWQRRDIPTCVLRGCRDPMTRNETKEFFLLGMCKKHYARLTKIERRIWRRIVTNCPAFASDSDLAVYERRMQRVILALRRRAAS